MQRKFVTNLALLLFLNLLIKPFWILGIDRAVQNHVGSEIYGSYYALFNFSFLLNILLDLGITNFNNKNIAQNNHLVEKHLSSIILLKVMLSVVYIVVTILCGLFIGYTMHQASLLFVLAGNQILISFILYLRSNLSGLHLFKTDSFISVLDRLIMISICGVLLWSDIANHEIKMEWFIYAQSCAYFLTALITLVIVMDRAKLKRLKWSFSFFMIILKQSYPFAILVLLMTFYNRIDTVMLERMLPDGARQSGIYASAYRMLDATNMIAFLFAGLLLPIFAKMIKQKESVEEMVKLSASLLIVPAIIIAFGSFAYREEIMGMLYHEHIEESAQVFGRLMFCFIAISTTYIFGTLLTANGNLKELNIIACSGMFINIVLNFILIPTERAAGSSFSSLTTQFLTALSQVIMVQYLFKFKINYRFLFSLVVFAGAVGGIELYSKNLSSNWVISFTVATSVCFLLAFTARLISIRSLIQIIKHG